VSKAERRGAIDGGANSIRMLVAEYYQRVFGTELPESVVSKA
jgi:exopolyphosphatase/pppGpp-phosphohydrolase